jgi:hypothetical protein
VQAGKETILPPIEETPIEYEYELYLLGQPYTTIAIQSEAPLITGTYGCEEGKQLVVVKVAIKNISKKNLPIVEADWTLWTAGEEYAMVDVTTNIFPDAFVYGKIIEPGELVTYRIVFCIDDTARDELKELRLFEGDKQQSKMFLTIRHN